MRFQGNHTQKKQLVKHNIVKKSSGNRWSCVVHPWCIAQTAQHQDKGLENQKYNNENRHFGHCLVTFGHFLSFLIKIWHKNN